MKYIECLLLLLLIGTGCKTSPIKEDTDTPTSGSTRIAADATLQLVVESEIKAFERIYEQADVQCFYDSEAEIFKALIQDSVKAVIAARELTAGEKAHFKQKDIVPRYIPIGADAIVLLVNQNNPDSLLTFKELQTIFQGTTKDWKNLNQNNPVGKITIVFDNEGSSTVTSTMRLLALDKLPANAYALQNNAEVMDHVAKNRNALGVVGMSWISDLSDTDRMKLEEKLTIVYLQPENYNGERYFKPDQINISEGNYPLFRRLQIINCEGKSGLMSGFGTYVASPNGQLILLKAGILSATLPERVVRSN